MRYDTKVSLYLIDLKGYDVIDFEIAPVKKVGENFNIMDENELSKENKPSCWSVYVRVEIDENFSPVQCIADFPKKKQALKFKSILESLTKY